MKSFIFSTLLAITMFGSNVSASACPETHPDHNQLSDYSGCVKRPVLIVHGINSFSTDMGITAEGSPQTNLVQEYTIPHDALDEEGPFFTRSIPLAYVRKYETSMAWTANSPLYGINHNGVEFYSTAEDNDPIHDQSIQLYNRLKAVLDEYYPDWRYNITRKIDLIGHSQGGLVIRYMIRYNQDSQGSDFFPHENNLENPINHINHIVTANSPHSGVGVADIANILNEIKALPWGIGNSISKLPGLNQMYQFLEWGAQFAPHGSLIQSLKGNPKRPLDNEKIPFTAMWGQASGLTKEVIDGFTQRLSENYCHEIISYTEAEKSGDNGAILVAKRGRSSEEIAFLGSVGNVFEKIGSSIVENRVGDVLWEGATLGSRVLKNGKEMIELKYMDGRTYLIEQAKIAGEGLLEYGCEYGVKAIHAILEGGNGIGLLDGLYAFANQTDMTIEWWSQTGLSMLPGSSPLDHSDPSFKATRFAGDVVPHRNSSTWLWRVGADFRGTEIVTAIESQPQTLDDSEFMAITPTILSPLLLP